MDPLTDSDLRKGIPIFSAALSYFPDALAAVSVLCRRANDKHSPGEPMHWARDKSADQLDCLARHLLTVGEFDVGVLELEELLEDMDLPDDKIEAVLKSVRTELTREQAAEIAGRLHDAAVAWRALAHLQVTMERLYGLPKSRGSR